MKCEDCVSIAQAEWRDFMKIYFHGFGGLPQQAKNAFCVYKCTACQLAK